MRIHRLLHQQCKHCLLKAQRVSNHITIKDVMPFWLWGENTTSIATKSQGQMYGWKDNPFLIHYFNNKQHRPHELELFSIWDDIINGFSGTSIYINGVLHFPYNLPGFNDTVAHNIISAIFGDYKASKGTPFILITFGSKQIQWGGKNIGRRKFGTGLHVFNILGST